MKIRHVVASVLFFLLALGFLLMPLTTMYISTYLTLGLVALVILGVVGFAAFTLFFNSIVVEFVKSFWEWLTESIFHRKKPR